MTITATITSKSMTISVTNNNQSDDNVRDGNHDDDVSGLSYNCDDVTGTT